MSNRIEVDDEVESVEALAPQSRINLFDLTRRHYGLLIVGAVVGCIIGALYYARATPVYESNAQILVVNKSRNASPVISTNGNGNGTETASVSTEDYLSTHQTLIHSPAIVGAAVRKAKLANLPSLAGEENPTGTIIRYLKLSQELNGGKPTSILNISFRGSHAEDLPTVLTAVIENYQQFVSDRYRNVADETAKLIIDANTILEKKLTRKQKEYDEFLSHLPTALWKGKDGMNSVQVQLMSLEARRVDLLNRQAELQGRLMSLEKALKDGRYNRAELLAMIAQTPQSPGGGGSSGKETTSVLTIDRLMALELQEKTLMEDYGPDHAEVRAVREQLGLLRAQARLPDKDSERDDNDVSVDPVRTHVQALKLELENIQMASEMLSKLHQKAHGEAKPLRGLEIKDESYRMDIARSQQLFDAIAKRLDEVSILKNFTGGYEAEIISPPQAGVKIAPKALIVLASSLIMGLLFGFGLAYLAEIADQSFRTPEEVRRRLGLPVVGHIPFFAPEDKEKLPVDGPQVDPILCTAYRPKSREAEAYRGVRTALFFNRGGGRSVIQVTSPDMGDGKSTLITNLAVSIAQAEKKVILIDADLRRPRVHKMFNLKAEQGLVSVMNGEAELNDVIQTSRIPSLSILPAGPTPPNPAELLTLPRFKELLAYIREKYDFVLIDTPPLLAVTDPCVVVPYVDGVLLTIRISKNARPHALRAKEILSTLGGHVIGVVVNGVGTDAKGYGYDGYRHGYNYYYDSHRYQDYYSSDTAEGEGARANGAANTPKKRRSASRRSSQKKTRFFSWLFDL